MEPPSSNMRTFSISVPGIAQPVTSEDVSSQLPSGLFSNLPVSEDAGAFEYSEGRLGALLGETGPILHPNLNTSIYTRHMNTMLTQRDQRPSPAWSFASLASIAVGVATSMIYKYGESLPLQTGVILAGTALFFGGLAALSCFAAFEAGSAKSKQRLYSYHDSFAGSSTCITWKEYWQEMMIEGCGRKKLGDVAGRAKQFGFRLRQLRNPRLSTKQDGTPLSGVDIRNFMMYNNDKGFAAITSLFWAVEAARRAVGKPLQMEIRSVPTNAKFFLKLAEALTGRKPEGVSLPSSSSQPVVDLLDGAAYYLGLGNNVPTQAAALAALLARYYYDSGYKNNASLMMHSMKYALQGKWHSAYETHMSVLRKPVNEHSVAERRAVSALHHLGIARLIHERVIDGHGHEVIPSAYAYAYGAARTFNSLAYEELEVSLHFRTLASRALEIMQVMSANGPFVEFR